MAMRRPRFALVKTTCRRCGAPIVTGSHALIGSDQMKARYGSICDSCITLEEREAMDQDFRRLLFGAQERKMR